VLFVVWPVGFLQRSRGCGYCCCGLSCRVRYGRPAAQWCMLDTSADLGCVFLVLQACLRC